MRSMDEDKGVDPNRDELEDLDLDVEVDEAASTVRGGKTPTPGGPIPVPYPNQA